MSDEKTIQELEDDVKAATVTLGAAKQALWDARVAASGFAIGDVVMSEKGQEYRVIEIDGRWSTAWLKVNPKKKNGEWSKAVRNIHGRYAVVVS